MLIRLPLIPVYHLVFMSNAQTSIARDTCKDDPSDTDRPGCPMHCSVEASHSIGQMDVAIDVAVQAVDYTEVARCGEAPEQHRQHLHTDRWIIRAVLHSIIHLDCMAKPGCGLPGLVSG